PARCSSYTLSLHDALPISRLRSLRDRLENAAREIPGARIAGVEAPRVCNTLNVAFEGCDGETLLAALDLEGIAVSTGSACSSGRSEEHTSELQSLAYLVCR